MEYRLQKYVVKEVVEYIRRIFKYATSWTNEGIEVVEIEDGETNPLAFEQFFEENERYPIITVNAVGSNLSHSSLNNLIDIADKDSVVLGEDALSCVPISATLQCNVSLPTSLANETFRGLFVTLASDLTGVPGEDIDVRLYSDFTTTPILVSSGSITGNEVGSFESYFCEMSPSVVLSGSDYWLQFTTCSGSVYNIAIDPQAIGTYQSGASGSLTTSSGSIVGELLMPAVAILGTMSEGTVLIKASSKNTSATAFNLSELIGQYLELGKVALFTRASGAVNNTKAFILSANNLPTLSSKGIHIKTIRIGNVENRPRGANDRIFSISLTLDYMSEWNQEYPTDILKSITEDIDYFS
jgi:hypothetical protein